MVNEVPDQGTIQSYLESTNNKIDCSTVHIITVHTPVVLAWHEYNQELNYTITNPINLARTPPQTMETSFLFVSISNISYVTC
jgi:hypothetical protein